MRSLPRKFAVAGFTLIEVMITVAVIAILAAVALPQYFDYVTRSRLVEARANLADWRTRMEQYFLDNRAYPTTCVAASATPGPGEIRKPGNAKFFDYTCSNMSATTYQLNANDTFTSGGTHFVFNVNEANVRQTTSVPAGWNTPSTPCWIQRKSGEC